MSKKQDWDHFWNKLDRRRSYLSKFLRFYRVQIIARAVNYYINKYLEPDGIFVECGAGASETTLRTIKANRTFVALDYSEFILRKAIVNPKIDHCVNADIYSLPFKNDSVDGIWNVGVMEHFSMEDIDKILQEFKRVLKKNGKVILFWPMVFSFHEIFLNCIEFISSSLMRNRIQLYPDEISRLKSRKQGEQIALKNNFKDVNVYFNFRDAFSFGVLVGRKES